MSFFFVCGFISTSCPLRWAPCWVLVWLCSISTVCRRSLRSCASISGWAVLSMKVKGGFKPGCGLDLIAFLWDPLQISDICLTKNLISPPSLFLFRISLLQADFRRSSPVFEQFAVCAAFPPGKALCLLHSHDLLCLSYFQQRTLRFVETFRRRKKKRRLLM